MTRLREHYKSTVEPALMERFGYQSVMQIPRLEKITINMGVGEALADKKVLDHAVADLTHFPCPPGNQGAQERTVHENCFAGP